MTSYDKVVKLACKPKAAPPKSKYLEPIIAATWSEDGAVHDVCKALAPRFREPNAIVVFKALIVLHTMIRNGNTDNVLSYLASSTVLRLQNVSTGNWEGYKAPQNLQAYSLYLDSRIRGYREIKHDAVRVQSETNRDLRLSIAIQGDGPLLSKNGGKSSISSASDMSRSKNPMSKKLRVLTVEKGLLKETKAVQKMIDTLVECRFYLDDLEDELTTSALRMLIMDLLILFQAVNTGVINVLENYCSMSHVDAKQALSIYRHFCKQTERVVEYLGVAKKLQNLLSVPIPNLKFAPVSLAGALQEYLDDPDFEQNRLAHRAKQEAGEATSSSSKTTAPSASTSATTVTEKDTSTEAQATSSTTTALISVPATGNANAKRTKQDFFASIEEEQHNMFNPQTGSPSTSFFHQQAATNPFSHAQMTGMAAFSQPQIQPQPTIYAPMQIQIQPTGFPMAQASAMSPISPQQQVQLRQRSASNPFGGSSSQPNAFLQAQPTGYLQTQMTGANPFRQSMAFPQATGFAPVASMPTGFVPPTGFNPFQTPTPSQGSGSSSPFGQPSPFLSQTAGNPSSFPPPFALPSGTAPAATATSAPFSQHPSNVPPRPASTPLTNTNPLRQTLTPVKSHQTGSRNPFGAPVAEVPPVPKPPTLMELAMMSKGGFGAGAGGAYANGNGDAPQPQQEAQPAGALNSTSGQAVSDMGGVASSFLFSKGTAGSGPTGIPSFLSSQSTSTTMTSDSTTTTADRLFSPLSSNPTGATTSTTITSGTFGSPAPSVSILKPQPTGFGGIKPFKPSSSFGASLMESLPPIPQSSSSTPTTSPTSPTLTAPKPNFMLSQPQAFPSSAASGTGTAGAAPSTTAPTLQPTGFGAFSQSVGASAFGGQGQIQPKGTTSTLGVGLRPQMTGGTANPFRASMFASPDMGMASAFIASGPPVSVGAGVGTPFATTAWPQQNGGSLI